MGYAPILRLAKTVTHKQKEKNETAVKNETSKKNISNNWNSNNPWIYK